jgi:hypothetical protein
MATSRLKLKTNVPLTGFAKYANYYAGKKGWLDPEDNKTKDLPDNIQLKGSWDGTQDDSLFLPIALLGAMLDMGLVRQEQRNDKFGNPAYTVLNQTRKIRVIKIETGEKNKKRTYISWADAPPPEEQPAQPTSPPAAQRSTPPPSQSAPQPPAKATGPAKGNEVTDSAKLAQIRKVHRKALNTISETQANAWRSAKHQIDTLLLEWGIEKTKLPMHVYLDLIARFGASSGIEAFKQNLVVEHKERPAAETPRPGVAAQAAVPLKAPGEAAVPLEPVVEHDGLDENPFPGVEIDDNDELPF